MRAGALDRQIIIERPVSTPDSNFGTAQVSWQPLSVDPTTKQAEIYWASVFDPMPGRSEGLAQGLISAKLPTRIRMRFRDDVDTSMRVRLKTDGDDLVYQIVGGPSTIAAEGRKTLMELLCERYSS